MTIENINELYTGHFSCSAEVVFDYDTLDIYLDGRDSVTVSNIDEATACTIAEKLLQMWDFSYRLEFNNEVEVYEYFK